MSKTTGLQISPTCHLELDEYETFPATLSLNYIEHSPAHGYSDSETSIDISAEKAAELIAFLQKFVASLPSPDYQRGQEEMRERAIQVAKDQDFENHVDCDGCRTARIIAEQLRALPAQQESVCEWAVTGEGTVDTRFRTGCGIYRRIVGSMPCEGELCYCSRPIRLGGKG